MKAMRDLLEARAGAALNAAHSEAAAPATFPVVGPIAEPVTSRAPSAGEDIPVVSENGAPAPGSQTAPASQTALGSPSSPASQAAPADPAPAVPADIEQMLLTTMKRRIATLVAALGGTTLSISSIRSVFDRWHAGLHEQGIQLRFVVASVLAMAAALLAVLAVRRVRSGAVAARTVARGTGATSPDGKPRWNPPKSWPLVLGLASSVAASLGGTELWKSLDGSLNQVLATSGMTAAGIIGAAYSFFRVYRQTAAADRPPSSTPAAPLSVPMPTPASTPQPRPVTPAPQPAPDRPVF